MYICRAQLPYHAYLDNTNTSILSKIQQCICDEQWQGYDCSQRKCPYGIDPLTLPSPTTPTSIIANVYNIQCQATSGYFSIYLFNRYTQPIPYNANIAYFKYALESLESVGRVYIVNDSGQICGNSEVIMTSLILSKYSRASPLLTLSLATAGTRSWADGGNTLQLIQQGSSNTEPVLRMMTQYSLHCPLCIGCSGKG